MIIQHVHIITAHRKSEIQSRLIAGRIITRLRIKQPVRLIHKQRDIFAGRILCVQLTTIICVDLPLSADGIVQSTLISELSAIIQRQRFTLKFFQGNVHFRFKVSIQCNRRIIILIAGSKVSVCRCPCACQQLRACKGKRTHAINKYALFWLLRTAFQSFCMGCVVFIIFIP